MKWLAILIFVCPLLITSAFSSNSESVGHTYDGSLLNGINLHEALRDKNLKIDLLSPSDFQYVNKVSLELIISSAKFVNSKWNLPLKVGDASLPSGGPMAEHVNHQNGLEADIGYLPVKAGKLGHRFNKYNNRFPEDFVTKTEDVSPNLDLEKSFLLVKHIVDHFDVEVILMSRAIIRAFITHEIPGFTWVQKKALLPKLIHRRGHTDHFHVKLRCPIKNARCINETDPWKNPPGSNILDACPKSDPNCVSEMTEQEFQQLDKKIEGILAKNRERIKQRNDMNKSEAPVLLFHILSKDDLNAFSNAKTYSPASLKKDGFIHLSTSEQLLGTANAFFTGKRDLLVFEIKADPKDPHLKWEAAPSPNTGRTDKFPHYYSNLPMNLVLRVLVLEADPKTRLFSFPSREFK